MRDSEETEIATGKTVISIDAMGGDRGPASVVAGMAKSASKNPDIRYILHGDPEILAPLIRRRATLVDITDIRTAQSVIDMAEKPSRALRRGKGSSMWGAVQSVAQGEASVAVSCGNTGALMALSMLKMRLAPGVHRPAIAVMWPSRSAAGYSIVLDVGADVRADQQTLFQYAIMGAEYARVGLGLERPRVGLLNVGTEDHKGSADIHQAAEMIALNAALPASGYSYIGYVEGNDISRDTVDVVVTDGFTGNIALKTAEGTAELIRTLLSEGFKHTWLSRLAGLLALTSLGRLRKRIDPRRVNGGVFVGLNGAVVKSHGSADATGVSAAIKLAFRMAHTGFTEKVAERLASTGGEGEDDTKV